MKYWLLHGVAVEQIWTLATGSFAAGPKFGTACGALVEGVGLDFDEEVGVGDVAAVELVPWWPSRFTATIPRMITTTTAAATGISQGGLSDRMLAGRSRGIAGRRTAGGAEERGRGAEPRGIGGGVRTRALVDSAGTTAGAAAAAANAASAASAATSSSPGQACDTIGVHVRSAGPGAGGAGSGGAVGRAAAGGFVAGAESKGDAGAVGERGGAIGGRGGVGGGAAPAPVAGGRESHLNVGTPASEPSGAAEPVSLSHVGTGALGAAGAGGADLGAAGGTGAAGTGATGAGAAGESHPPGVATDGA